MPKFSSICCTPYFAVFGFRDTTTEADHNERLVEIIVIDPIVFVFRKLENDNFLFDSCAFIKL